MIGFGALFLALIATGIAAFYYINNHMSHVTRRSGQVRTSANGKTWYIIAAGLIGTAALYLLYVILDNQFQYAYVYSYSSRELALAYKLSAFWAGQEGSFLLWLVFHCVFGLVLIYRQNASAAVMSAYNLLQVLLLILLLAKSPFMMLAELPSDGAGLNPLLQDPWMVIHPPIVFLGYAGLAVPFCLAMDGLLTRKHTEWITPALSWTLFSWAALGAGIFIGGYWAYKVLGWGGYWAWDPVENSSLVPWLVAGALVHVLFLARVRAAGVKLAYMGSLASFVLVLYGTFLTRSGVLSDFSTHSFADEGIGGLLGGFVLLTAVISGVLLILRWEEMPPGEIYPAVKSREFILACTSLVFAILAALVFIGMSTPVLTTLLGRAQNVNTSFYNSTALPLAVALAVLLTIGPVIRWGDAGFRGRKYWWAILAGHVGIPLTFSHGIYNPLLVSVVFFSFAGLAMNSYAAAKKLISRPAGLTHAGVALALIGIMLSSAGSQSQITNFEPGQEQLVFGQKITYQGIERIPEGNGFYQKFLLEGEANALLYSQTKLNKEGNPAAREPGIYRGLAADLYFAPIMKKETSGGKEVILRKGEQTLQEGLQIRFLQLSMNNGKSSNEEVRVQALLEVKLDGRAATEISPELVLRNGRILGMPMTVFEQYEITLQNVNPSDSVAKLSIRNLAVKTKSDRIDVEISRKPLVNLVWLGTLLITAGTCWAGSNWLRRYGQVKSTANEQQGAQKLPRAKA